MTHLLIYKYLTGAEKNVALYLNLSDGACINFFEKLSHSKFSKLSVNLFDSKFFNVTLYIMNSENNKKIYL